MVIAFSCLLFVVFLILVHFSAIRIASGFIDYLLVFFLLAVAIIIPSGYMASSLSVMNSPLLAISLVVLLAFILFLILRRILPTASKIIIPSLTKINGFSDLSIGLKIGFGILLFGFFACTIINLIVLMLTYPNEWDSMTSHLVKSALYLQNGNMGRVEGTTWAVDYYPNSLPTLQIFGFYLTGEKGFKLIHYVSYWVYVLSIFKIVKVWTKSDIKALFVFLISALLPTALIQATTTETDLIFTAYLSLIVYFALRLYFHQQKRDIYLLALILAIWVAHKVTFLLIAPAVFCLLLYFFVKSRPFRNAFLKLQLPFILFFMVYVIPNGYLANLKVAEKWSLGAISAPPLVMQWHGISDYSTKDKLKNFGLNVLRYSSDFLHLDGIRNTEAGYEINKKFRYLPDLFFSKFDLERNQFWAVSLFKTHQTNFYQERPYWGIISFLMVLPLIFYLLYGFIKSRGKHFQLAVLFTFLGFIHFLCLCISAPYDPIKGRYFLNMAVWFLPLLSYFFDIKIFRVLTIPLMAIIFVTALMTLTFRKLYPLVGENNIFETNRLQQLSLTRPELYPAYVNFEKLVPKDAIVALGTQQEHEDFEYPLWGPDFKRKLIQIHPFRSKVKPIPKEAEYLFYSEGVIDYQDGDIALNEGNILDDSPVEESKFFLRKLKP